MTKPDLLQADELAEQLKLVPQWQEEDKALARNFEFANFVQAFGFMTKVAMIAERMDHHPDWGNIYNRVQIILTTHVSGGITYKDIELARAIDELVA